MEPKGQVEVRAEEETFQPKSEKVFRVEPPSVKVGPGETFDILLDCSLDEFLSNIIYSVKYCSHSLFSLVISQGMN